MRIRTIKPEFWSSDDIAGLDLEDRLLFIGLWSYVDDNGVGLDKEHLIVSELFPRDLYMNHRETIARVSRGLQHLFLAGLIVRYEVDGEAFLQIVSWDKHQRIDRPNKPRFPCYTGDRETLARHSRDYRANVASGTEEQGNRGTGEQYSLRSTEVETRKDSKPTTYPEDFERFWSVYPAKRDKRGALKAFKEAKKRADVETIIAGAQRYAAWCGTNPERKIKYPQGWLSGDRWADDLTSSDGGERFDPYRALANAVQQQSNFQPLPAGGDQWQ